MSSSLCLLSTEDTVSFPICAASGRACVDVGGTKFGSSLRDVAYDFDFA